MNACAENWTACAMMVQDLIVPGLNIAAEIPHEDAHNFQDMCQMFSNGHQSSVPKREPKTPPMSLSISTSSIRSSQSSLQPHKPSVSRTKQIKDNKPKTPPNLPKKPVAKKSASKSVASTLDDAIKNGSIFDSMATELITFTSRCNERIPNETRILRLLKSHFKIFDRSLTLIPFGSSSYGFGGAHSNYNILVDTRK